MICIAINGFGRIGRMVLRSIVEYDKKDIQIVAINDIGDVKTLLHLLQYDSIHGKFNAAITIEQDQFKINSSNWIKVFSKEKACLLPWQKLNVDIVIECSGQKKSKELILEHVQAGAKKIIVSTIVNDADLTVIYGINHKCLTRNHTIISNASCTSNCLITTLYPLHKSVGIERGHVTSIHAYTSDQSLVDSYHHDLRRARAINTSIIPSNTNASIAVDIILPELKDRIHCTAARVPILNVSMIDFNFVSKIKTCKEEIHSIILEATKSYLKDIITSNDKQLVSIDFIHNPYSAIIDFTQTQVTAGYLCKVVAWYDNEWAYANRICDVISYIYHNHLY